MANDGESSITCTYTLSKHLARYTTADPELLSVEIPIPPPEFSDVDEYVAVFGGRGLLDVVDEVELRKELINFIRDETQKYQEKRDDALIMEALEKGFELPDIDTNHADIDVSSLLQMSISLYGRQLSGLVMLVPRDPLWHSSSGSEFARVCEQSTELHFDPLPKQLQGVVESVGLLFAKIWREESASERTKVKDGNEKISKASHDTALEVGDVYCTRHSNLRDVQLVFHLVVDDALQSSDLSSRHPCLNGIRNIIRLTVRLGITSIHLPLLLVEQASENMTIAWCVRRAEMVYKCVKGYLMEAEQVLTSSKDPTLCRAPFAPLAARYPSAHRRALAAYDSEDESDLVAAITSVAISAVNDRTMQPDMNGGELPGEHANA
ncbi:hypothetical protein TELCIR_18052 [Teladorsagia circumcincta]|uniref:Uncharacterized protein n=1 Tax=Teladorsagia circumcincta TaxID=45464 RepID=A0A2G9TR37_TELCI|nr:hypothetical protein TELCIR_18052 [Teladorsagia circumcincta]